MFGLPILLERNANDLAANTLTHSPVTPLIPPLTPSCKQPHCDCSILNQVSESVKEGAQHLDSLWDSNIAVQEVSGVMAVAMLWQQGEMQEVATWEIEVGDAIQEVGRMVSVEDQDL